MPELVLALGRVAGVELAPGFEPAESAPAPS